jgi:hypothetical protein
LAGAGFDTITEENVAAISLLQRRGQDLILPEEDIATHLQIGKIEVQQGGIDNYEKDTILSVCLLNPFRRVSAIGVC